MSSSTESKVSRMVTKVKKMQAANTTYKKVSLFESSPCKPPSFVPRDEMFTIVETAETEEQELMAALDERKKPLMDFIGKPNGYGDDSDDRDFFPGFSLPTESKSRRGPGKPMKRCLAPFDRLLNLLHGDKYTEKFRDLESLVGMKLKCVLLSAVVQHDGKIEECLSSLHFEKIAPSNKKHKVEIRMCSPGEIVTWTTAKLKNVVYL